MAETGAVAFRDDGDPVADGLQPVTDGLFSYGVKVTFDSAMANVDDVSDVTPVPELDFFLQPSDVEAVEIYHGTYVPVEFGVNSCGAIVVWTRGGEPTGTQEGLWRRVLFAVGLLSLTILLTR